MERILILGCSGAGKSTLCPADGRHRGPAGDPPRPRVLASGLDAADYDEFTQSVARLIEGPRWIIDGNTTATCPFAWRGRIR